MDDILQIAVESVRKSQVAYCKFITPNDTGATKSHQYGFHIHKSAWSLFLNEPGNKGSNLDRFISIKWQNDFETLSRFIYYGVGTRNEYRITRFGKDFPFLEEENVGNLLIINRVDEFAYEAFVLSRDADIEAFLAAVGISIVETNRIIPKAGLLTTERALTEYLQDFLDNLKAEFPTSIQISDYSRHVTQLYHKPDPKEILINPDRILLTWLDLEYQIFKFVENSRYSKYLHNSFESVDELIGIANTILQRRKSRAGRSLENHLAEVFTGNMLRFEMQATTEQNKKPDFIFPGGAEYHNSQFDFSKLIFLGAKTTCKDRWRQIINEADRIPYKHLFTLQQGISSNQLLEMRKEKVTLVVPKTYINSFPEEFREGIMSLSLFVNYVKEKQS